MEGGLKIGELARRAGVTAKAIRFYERTRVLPPTKRAANRYRLYDDDAVGMRSFVKQATGLGLTLAHRLLRDEAAEVDRTLAALLDLRRRIRRSLTAWKRRPVAAAIVCPHIETPADRGQRKGREV